MGRRVKILIGADPELFMRHSDNGEFISAHDRIRGTKWKPFKVPYGAVQVDGTALEFNIDPANTVDEFAHNIRTVRRTLERMVPGYNVVAEPVAVFDQEYFKYDVPSSAQDLGCDPDYNGWIKDINPRPDPDGKPIRTGAGHIHVGWTNDADIYDKDHFLLACKVSRQLDYYLGAQSLRWDPDPTRRLLYGKAGAFRPKSYGMEYRVLSNRWLSSDALTRWVYKSCVAGVNAGLEDDQWAEDRYGDRARQIIDNNIVDWQDDFGLQLEAIP